MKLRDLVKVAAEYPQLAKCNIAVSVDCDTKEEHDGRRVFGQVHDWQGDQSPHSAPQEVMLLCKLESFNFDPVAEFKAACLAELESQVMLLEDGELTAVQKKERARALKNAVKAIKKIKI